MDALLTKKKEKKNCTRKEYTYVYTYRIMDRSPHKKRKNDKRKRSKERKKQKGTKKGKARQEKLKKKQK